jgi:hypothetical protein
MARDTGKADCLLLNCLACPRTGAIAVAELRKQGASVSERGRVRKRQGRVERRVEEFESERV